jgi:hypothetical protein
MSNLPDSISIEWHYTDVQEVADLTDDEAREVLRRVKKYHDANIGINWEVLEVYADDLIREKERAA